MSRLRHVHHKRPLRSTVPINRIVIGCAAFAAALLAATANGAVITHGGTTVNMDFVTVGDPGNAGDGQSQGTFGAVDYVYNIGKYEVTKNQWDAVSSIADDLLTDSGGYWSGNQPAAHISWHEAAMFTNWLTSGNVTQGAYAIDSGGLVTGIDRASAQSSYGTVYFLPTENEWYKAAYYDPNKSGGPGYWDYPTRHDSPDVPDGIDSAIDAAFDAVFLDTYNQGYPNAVDNAGILSAYGTMGQGGNVEEWNETAVESRRGFRGGSFYTDAGNLLAATRSRNDPWIEGSNIGFRVASSVPEPGSLLVWAGLGVMGLIWFRRRK